MVCLQRFAIIGLALGAIASGPASAATIAHYRFENNLNDSSGNGFNATGGTGFGYSTNTPGATISPGSLANTASYSQGTAGSTVTTNTALTDTFEASSFTVEAFVYLNASAGNFQQILKSTAATGGVYFAVGAGSHSGDFAGTPGLTGVRKEWQFGGGLTTEEWHHVAFVGTYTAGNGTALEFFVDGVQVGATQFYAESGGVAMVQSSADFSIGGSTNNLNGLIDELRISNEALAPSQFLIAVPEPGSMTLLGAAGLALLRRRRA